MGDTVGSYHLLIETPDGNLALGMRQLNGVYTQLFNKRQGIYRVAHLKGTVKRKQLSYGEKRYVSCRALSLSSSLPLPQFHWFRCQSSLHQSPIGIKVIGETLYP